MVRSGRSTASGLSKMEAPAGSVLAYACAPGATAGDGPGRNGIFTSHLLKHLHTPGVDVDRMLRAVARGVYEETRGAQDPYHNHNLRHDSVCLTGTSASHKIQAVPDEPSADELADWLTSVCDFKTDETAGALPLLSAQGVTEVIDLKYVSDDVVKAMNLKPITANKLRAGLGALKATSSAAPGSTSSEPAAGVRACVRALVVGINAYAPGLQLMNAVSDARAVHAALSALPGATSELLTDCTKAELEAALSGFSRRCKVAATAKQPTIGIVFFAGHGMQVGARHCLVPSDFDFRESTDSSGRVQMKHDTAAACISLDLVATALDGAGVSVGTMWLDCSFDVPAHLQSLGATLSADIPSAIDKATSLTITFASVPGKMVLDSSRRVPEHSPFTAALLLALNGGGAPKQLKNLFPFLLDEVRADTGGMQSPYSCGAYGIEAGNLLLA